MNDGETFAMESSLRDILSGTFCSNRDYQLVVFDHLTADLQDILRDLTRDPDFYGVLLPGPGSERTIKSVCQNVALLIYTLREPGRIPTYFLASLGARTNQCIAELVLDGVLMIEDGETFVCGCDAFRLVYREPKEDTISEPPSELALQALHYGEMLHFRDSGVLSTRLYMYNRVPASPRWRKQFPDREAVANWLGIDQKGELRLLLENGWKRLADSLQSDGWVHWKSRTRGGPKPPENGYKLYVSPAPEATREAFRTVVACVVHSQAFQFKVGDDVYGLLRPDKIVIYFRTFSALEQTARALAGKLAGCPAQGVPFTAAFEGSRLLSWGVDPPRQTGVLEWQEQESWRLWITNRLATAMIVASNSKTNRLPPWKFALERLRLDAIDTSTWTPLADFCRSSTAETSR